jgi:hypothetical protein
VRAGFAAALVCAIAAIAGAALWSRPASAGRASPPRPADPASDWPDAAEDLGRALLLLLDDRRRAAAIVGDRVHADLLLAAAVPPDALGERAGAVVDTASPVERELVRRLLLLAGTDPSTPVPDGLHVAWAGSRSSRGPFLLRLHAPGCAVEWVRTDDGVLHSMRRDFADKSAAPWLREQLRGRPGR